MSDGNEIRQNIQRISDLVREIESITDPAVHAATKDLVQSLMDLHGAALEKALMIVSEAGEPGVAIIDRLGHDPMVSSVLILYDLHPEDIASRITRAVDRIRPQLRKQGCELELLGVNDGVVRLRAEIGSHACGSTLRTLHSTLEEAMYDAAPDLTTLAIEGFEEKPASAFIALDKLIPAAAESKRPQNLIAPSANASD